MNNEQIDQKIKSLEANLWEINSLFPKPCPERASLISESAVTFGLVFLAELIKRLPEPNSEAKRTPGKIPPNTRVKLIDGQHEINLPHGTIGTVMQWYEKPEAYKVTFGSQQHWVPDHWLEPI